MADHDDGGPAFPIPVDDRPGAYEAHPGMSLLDWFAGQALAGLCAHTGSFGNTGGPDVMAVRAYEVADAMIAAKRQREGGR
jgi:hypothetical protein